MSEKTLRRHAQRAGLELLKIRGGRLFLLWDGKRVVVATTTASDIAAHLDRAA